MLEFQRLKAPPHHGGVLVVPAPALCRAAALGNARQLDNASMVISGKRLGDWRTETRRRLLGRDHGPVVVVGHQPEFIHPGVWAKNVFVQRLAGTIGGVGLNLLVDSDAPRQVAIRVPVQAGGTRIVQSVRFLGFQPGLTYDQLPALAAGQVQSLRQEIHKALGNGFARSQLPVFFEALSAAPPKHGWVGQMTAGRRAIERKFGIELVDLPVGTAWWSPILGHLLAKPREFAQAYNQALAQYRREQGVRSADRPIPDLAILQDRVELPLWAYRDGAPRLRLFIKKAGEEILLFAGQDGADEGGFFASAKSASEPDDWVDDLYRASGWHIRPRALMTTLWARLFLADLFVHGIGGAKYDRITDRIIQDHFGFDPPEIACVSATLHLLPGETPVRAAAARLDLRDSIWNPQRHLPPGSRTPETSRLMDERAAAVQRAVALRKDHPQSHDERRAEFARIREWNRALHAHLDPDLSRRHAEVEKARQGELQARIACDREYFFALYDDDALGLLLAALPGPGDFV